VVGAMKHGNLLVIRLANSAPSLFSKWHDEKLGHNNKAHGTAYFPEDIFYEGGKRLREDNEWPYRLFRDADMYPNKNVAYCE
jgi:hypothetical protein